MTVETLKRILNALPSELPVTVQIVGKDLKWDVVSVECIQLGIEDPLDVILHLEDVR